MTAAVDLLSCFQFKDYRRFDAALRACSPAQPRPRVVESKPASPCMWITTDQAIDIYARYCKARFGARAPKLARARVAELQKSGDVEGERIWNEVTRRVEEEVRVPHAPSLAS